jgi:hypothetical protein
VVGHRVAEQPARADVDHRRQIQPAFTGRDVGDVLAPRPVWLTGRERPADQIRDHVSVRAGNRGPAPAADAAGCHAMQAHQAPDPFDVHDDATVAELAMHPWHAVVALGGVEHVAD